MNSASRTRSCAGSAREAASADDSPELWPSITSACTPSAVSSENIACPPTITASEPTSIACSRASSCLRRSGVSSVAAGKAMSVRVWPGASSYRPRQKSSHSRTSSKHCARSANMPRYCEPSPGNRKASLPSSRSAAKNAPARVDQALVCGSRSLGNAPANALASASRDLATIASRAAPPRSAAASAAAISSSCQPGLRCSAAASASQASASATGVAADSTHSSNGQRASSAGRLAAAGACSTMACVLMPPKPKESTPARRGAPSGAIQGMASVLTNSRVRSMPSSGLTASHSVGGSTRWCSDRAVLIRPAMPAAGMQWLIIDFTEPMAMLPCAPSSRAPNTFFSAAISVLSPSGMPVPWASIIDTVDGSTPVLS